MRPCWWFGALLIISALVSFGRTGVFEGPVFADARMRRDALAYAVDIDRKLQGLEPPVVVIVGHWEPSISGVRKLGGAPSARSSALNPDGVQVVYLADAAMLAQYAEEGRKIYYLPGADMYEKQVHGVALQQYGAQELPGR